MKTTIHVDTDIVYFIHFKAEWILIGQNPCESDSNDITVLRHYRYS